MLSMLLMLALCPTPPVVDPLAVLAFDASPGHADDAVAEMHRLYDAFLEGGQSAADRAALFAFWEAFEASTEPSGKYLLEKSTLLSWLDEDAESERVFERVPDAELELPYQFRNRLATVIDSDPERTQALMLAMAALDREAFAAWLHETYAFRLAPEPRADVDLAQSLALLDNLETAPSPAQGIAKGLRAWVALLVGETSEDALRDELRFDPKDDAAYMARYRLLMVGRAVERPALRVEAWEAQLELIGALEARQALATLDGLTRARERYVLAQACWLYAKDACEGETARQTTWLLRAARWAPVGASPQELKAMYYEQGCLGGPTEHRSAAAREFEALGQTESALGLWLDVVLQDPTQLREVRREFERLAPDLDFGAALAAAFDQRLPGVPALVLKALDGRVWTLGASPRSFAVLDFWGTWCGPCRADLPNIEAFHQELDAAADKRALVWTVACHDTLAAVQGFVDERGYTFPVTLDAGELEAAFGVSSFPTKILVTPQGHWMVLKPAFRGPYQDWRVLVHDLMSTLASA
jgi:thiol-disulfide isomerase/thioredoxin